MSGVGGWGPIQADPQLVCPHTALPVYRSPCSDWSVTGHSGPFWVLTPVEPGKVTGAYIVTECPGSDAQQTWIRIQLCPLTTAPEMGGLVSKNVPFLPSHCLLTVSEAVRETQCVRLSVHPTRAGGPEAGAAHVSPDPRSFPSRRWASYCGERESPCPSLDAAGPLHPQPPAHAGPRPPVGLAPPPAQGRLRVITQPQPPP